MRALAGRVLTTRGWVQGHVLLDRGRVVAAEKGPPPVAPVAEGTVVPAFVNAHTHVGDAAARGPGVPDELAAAVGPGGYKARALASLPEPKLVEGMRLALREMNLSGAGALVDFREGGTKGLQMLRTARQVSPLRARVYARPAGAALDPAEVRALLREADGLAVSSLADDPRASALAEAARAAGKGFALHHSEGAREPIDAALDLRPELLVHLVHADRGDLERVAQARCAAAVCPRSNARWAKRVPDVRAMLDLGLEVGLGTDNAMLGPADLLEEARALLRLAPGVRPGEALRMLCFGGRRALAPQDAPDPLLEGRPADLLVFRALGGAPELDVLGPGAALLRRERPVAGP